MHLYQGMILYDRIKNAIQPADTRDFQEELRKSLRETIPPASLHCRSIRPEI